MLQVKKVSKKTSKTIDQSKGKSGLVPNQIGGPGSKSAEQSNDEHQPHFTTGVVVSLAIDAKETDRMDDSGRDSDENWTKSIPSSEQEIHQTQSNSVYCSEANQSNSLLQRGHLETLVNYKKNAVDGFSSLQVMNSSHTEKENNKILMANLFKQIHKDQVDTNGVEIQQGYDEFSTFTSKRPKLSGNLPGPFITMKI